MNRLKRMPELMTTTLVLGPLALAACGKDDPVDTYPDKPITMLVPLAMGGGLDKFARMLGSAAESTLSTPFLVENPTGEMGTVGGSVLLSRGADGYTLLTGNAGTILIAPTTCNKTNVRWDAFEPVARIHGEEEFIFIRSASAALPETRFATLEELVTYSLTSTVTFAGSTRAGIDSFVFEFLKKEAAEDGKPMRANYLAHSGGGPAKAAFVSGRADVLIGNYSDVSAEIASGQFVPIAVASEAPSARNMAVPTLKSLGYEDVVLLQWRGVFVAKGTEPARIKKLAEGFQAALGTQPWSDYRTETGAVDLFLGPADFKTYLQSEQSRFEPLIDALDLRMPTTSTVGCR